MKLIDLKVEEFINTVDSKSAAPGGGSVSALSCSNGVALVRMVGHLSVNKKKFRALEESIKDKFQNTIDSLESIKIELTDLIDKDTDAFNLIMSAFKLPKGSEEEKAFRRTKIEEGTLEAIKVPYRVAEISLEALSKIEFIVLYGNKNTLSDLGVGVLMLAAGIEGAIMNVKINITGISDNKLRDFYSNEATIILESTNKLKENILKGIHSSL
jgi:formiminotetrahydrofolate cyclodeaminase